MVDETIGSMSGNAENISKESSEERTSQDISKNTQEDTVPPVAIKEVVSETIEDEGVVKGEQEAPSTTKEPEEPKDLELGAPEEIVFTSESGANITMKQPMVGETLALNDIMVRIYLFLYYLHHSTHH